MPGMPTSRIKQLVRPTHSEARNSSADENERALKPNSLSKSGSDSRTDSSSSTTETSEHGITPGCSSRIRCTSFSRRNGKRKNGAGAIVRLRPKTAMMTLDYRPTHGKPDSHAAVLGGIKSLKKSVPGLGIKADAGILYGEPHLIVCTSLRSDPQLPWTIVHGAHGVRGVLEQIQDHLLKLDAVPCHHREAVCEFSPENHPVSLKFAQGQRDHFLCSLIQIHGLGHGFLLAEEGA